MPPQIHRYINDYFNAKVFNISQSFAVFYKTQKFEYFFILLPIPAALITAIAFFQTSTAAPKPICKDSRKMRSALCCSMVRKTPARSYLGNAVILSLLRDSSVISLNYFSVSRSPTGMLSSSESIDVTTGKSPRRFWMSKLAVGS